MTDLLSQQLPVVMAGDPRLRRFLSIFEQTTSELYGMVGSTDLLLDVRTAPTPMVGWLGSVVDVHPRRDLPIAVRRRVVATAAETFPIRGTKRSIEANVAALAGVAATVEHPGEITSLPTPEPPPPAGSSGGSHADTAATPSVELRVKLRGPTLASEADIIDTIKRELPVDLIVAVDRIVTEDSPPRPEAPT